MPACQQQLQRCVLSVLKKGARTVLGERGWDPRTETEKTGARGLPGKAGWGRAEGRAWSQDVRGVQGEQSGPATRDRGPRRELTLEGEGSGARKATWTFHLGQKGREKSRFRF